MDLIFIMKGGQMAGFISRYTCPTAINPILYHEYLIIFFTTMHIAWFYCLISFLFRHNQFILV